MSYSNNNNNNSNISIKGGCTGFIAHSINPTRCRRCYKDISEHRQQQQQSPNDSTSLEPSSSGIFSYMFSFHF
ncbi:hypothetical protein BLA29_013486 [Euroglyphus maynei]|uniref:Uncharacterized protein n=1 Tax=Euroglyphus maynei TaxID=6958 RepID=A0A1Y3BU50_EURMA|nr:hypothetical protein BLA29_013486 [Euroglyphus maynei]